MRAVNTLLDGENVDFCISYELWLKEAFSEPTSVELDEMEKHFCKCLTVENRIITLKPANNQYYQPLQGA